MTLDHIGILVPQLDEAVQRWKTLFGYQRQSETVLNTRQKVRVVFLGKDGCLAVKLIEPSASDSPVFPAARRGGGLHHLCFRCPSIEAQIPLLQRAGATLIVPPQPGEAFNNHPIAFLLADNLNIELIDTAEKQGQKAAD